MRIAMLVLVGSSLGCSAKPVTAVEVELRYEEAWHLDQVSLRMADKVSQAEATTHLQILLPDAMAGKRQRLRVDGLHGDVVLAHGEVAVEPRLHETVTASVTLARIPCGAWCTEGATTCVGDGVATCVPSAEDGCMAWSEPVACGGDTPSCSLGECRASCIDECADGETRCDGPAGTRLCGNADSDSCRDWLPAIACAAGETCSNGACSTVCQDECTGDETACLGQGTVTCGDRDLNDCREWGPLVPCGDGESCSGGTCGTTCADDCSASECGGLSFHACGQFDGDSCKDLSPGRSCVPSDSCQEGSCTADGCASTPRVCEAPPASECIASDKLLVYDSVGECSSGGCSYVSREVDCPSCPACDACAGVTCDAPPSSCYATTGTCTDGSCSYAYDDGKACADADACTVDTTCALGTCSGPQKVCDAAPAPTCASTTKLRTYRAQGSCTGGDCSYPFTDTTCPSGACQDGACTGCTAAPWTKTTVDSGGANGANVAITTARDGTVHVVYLGDGDPKYATKAPGLAWLKERIANPTRLAKNPSIAVDLTGKAIAGYEIDRGFEDTDVLFAERDGAGAWASSSIGSSVDTNPGTALAADKAGTIHFFFQHEANSGSTITESLYYLARIGQAWTAVADVGDGGRDVSVVADDGGGLHVVFQHEIDGPAGGGVGYLHLAPGGSFTSDPVASSGFFGDTKVAVDAAGRVHVAYKNEFDPGVFYAVRTGASWLTTSVSPTATASSLGVTRAGVPHLAYLVDGALYHAYKTGSSWTTGELVDAGPGIVDAALAVAPDGGIHVVYVKGSTLVYAYECP